MVHLKRCQVTKHCSSVKEGTYRNTEKRRRGREFWDLTPREENIKEEGKRVFFCNYTRSRTHFRWTKDMSSKARYKAKYFPT